MYLLLLQIEKGTGKHKILCRCLFQFIYNITVTIYWELDSEADVEEAEEEEPAPEEDGTEELPTEFFKATSPEGLL